MAPSFSLGIDYGSNSVRALVVRCTDGQELGSCVYNYPSGKQGILLDPSDHHLARQHPGDYLAGLEATIRGALAEAAKDETFSADRVVGIGVDTTGSSPIPVDRHNVPLALLPKWKDNLAAQCWLWKDHTGHREAAQITAIAAKHRPQFIAKCGNTYSSEWFWSKIWRCLHVAPEVFEAACSWVELADYIPAVLAGVDDPLKIKRGICAAGHKAFFHSSWGGYPDEEFLSLLDPKLVKVRRSLPKRAYSIADAAGRLSAEWARKLGLRRGITIAVGAFDAHCGGVGSGIQPGTLVKIIGTSTCDMMVAPLETRLPDIPGLCGIVPESILPGYYGLEAGQSAVGDIFNWFVSYLQPGGPQAGSHEALTAVAEKIRPGQTGLLALDWNNGNRTILVDQRLTGLLLGQTLQTTPGQIYHALHEATAYGALTIINRFEEYGMKVEQVVNCGGIAEKKPFAMQMYADVTGRPMKISRSAQTCALGAAIAAAVVGGAHADFAAAQRAMTGLKPRVYKPNAKAHAVYRKLYPLYRQLHDAFGGVNHAADLGHVMKELIAIKEAQTKH